ncbi:MAG: type II and III secretion system protein [Planctomycetes bacterium]|nr:type II and III secretion system protein [Planctomycetota bacterium]
MILQALDNARRSLDLRLFLDARMEAAYVLELDSGNKEAREILLRANEVLGNTDQVPLRSVVSDAIVQDTIRREREMALIERERDQGRANMEIKQYGKAVENFERAAMIARFSAYMQPNDPVRKEAELLLTQAREAKVKAEQDMLDKAKTASEAELARIARTQAISKEQRLQSLLEAANLQFQDGNYQKSGALVEQALLLDPGNPDAEALREVADRARHQSSVDNSRERWRTEWNKTFLELQHSNVPQTETVVFDPARWSEVSKRMPAGYTIQSEMDSPENAAVAKLLRETVAEHNFASATVQDWASYYGQLTGVTFFVSQEVKDMAAETTTLTDFRLPRRSVDDALKAIQMKTGVAFRVKDGLVHLVTPANAIGNLIQQPYNVKELIQGVPDKKGPNLRLVGPGDDAPVFAEDEGDAEVPIAVVDEGRLQELIKSTIASDKWDGSPFSMQMLSGMLYIRADAETHAAVAALVDDLRRHVGIQVDVESRFLKVEDSFLEDIGIDLRGLGNQASQGLPGRGLENRPNAGFDDFGPRQQQNAAVPGTVGTGTTPGFFYDDGNDGDIMGRIENLYNQTLGGRNGGLTNAGGLSLQYAFLDDTEVEVVLRAVSKQERSEQIDAPRLLVYNNARANMSHLRQLSYIKDFDVEIAQAAAVANPIIGTVYDGVSLDVRPVVDSDLKFITMELRPSVVTLQTPIPTFTTTLGVGQPISIQLPEVTLQRVRTTVTMPDGGTMMLGGMRLVERQNLRSTVPLLGSLPGLSWLFSRNGTSVQNRKILILIRARIVLMEEAEPTLAPAAGGPDMAMK